MTVPGGGVSANNKVWRRFTFPAVVTTKVRVHVTGALDAHSRITELEAWGPSGAGGASVNWLVGTIWVRRGWWPMRAARSQGKMG